MNKKLTIYVVFLVLVVVLLIFVDAARPKPVNWTPTYKTEDKIPFGLYVLDKEAPKLFEGQNIEKFSITPYEYFEPRFDYDKVKYTVKGSFINIDEENNIDRESARELIYFAEHGNTVFLSMKSFPKTILDTLKVKTSTAFYYKDSIALTLNSNKVKDSRQYFSEGVSFNYFSSVDTLNTLILGHHEIDSIKQTNFIKVPFGAGSFILHTQPAVFSNFHLLKANHYKYTEDALSFIPKGSIYWYSKSFYGLGTNGSHGSPLRYILKQPALWSAMCLAMIGLIIFALFNARRKQRIIPEIAPVKNTTVDFTKTIGNLYFQEKQHTTIIEKKIIYFLEHIRTVYLIDTYSLDDEFVKKLHQKTGKPAEDIEKTVSLIKKHRHNFQSTEADVIEINKAIENLRL